MRYISAEELKHLLNESKYYDTKEGFAFSNMICECKTADVQEIKHGRWVHLGSDEWCCSECGFVITTEGSWDEPTGKYCTECGAKMDGEKE